MEAFLLAQQEAPTSGDLTPAPAPEPAQQTEVVLPPVQPAPAPQAEGGWMSDDEFAAALSRSGGIKAGSMRSEAITITRRQSAGPTAALLTDAYRAYQNRDLVNAEAAYRKVLALDSRNRDAWLGLGAIAVEAQRWGSASEIYLRLLGLNPRDSVAQAALIALQENIDPVQGESIVKTALQLEPDAPYLHFTLGNLYATQGRWAEAQNAYFDAYRLDSQNPDYAFNLAVGLEHLSQRRTAVEYYKTAVELARSHRASFDPSLAQKRIDTLSRPSGVE
jgi:tetratricopeptide (TPR) repeat protein